MMTTTQWNTYPIDFCLRYGRNERGIGCGQEAANRYCQLHGFAACSLFITTHYAANATWCLGAGRVNPADPDDRDSAIGGHSYFTDIVCVASAALAPGANGELEEPQGEVDGEVMFGQAPGAVAVSRGNAAPEKTGAAAGGVGGPAAAAAAAVAVDAAAVVRAAKGGNQ